MSFVVIPLVSALREVRREEERRRVAEKEVTCAVTIVTFVSMMICDLWVVPGYNQLMILLSINDWWGGQTMWIWATPCNKHGRPLTTAAFSSHVEIQKSGYWCFDLGPVGCGSNTMETSWGPRKLLVIPITMSPKGTRFWLHGRYSTYLNSLLLLLLLLWSYHYIILYYAISLLGIYIFILVFVLLSCIECFRAFRSQRFIRKSKTWNIFWLRMDGRFDSVQAVATDQTETYDSNTYWNNQGNYILISSTWCWW